MTDRELMQQALEALEEVQELMNTSEWLNSKVAALRERLEQPEQEHWDAIPDTFNRWWDADYDDTGNPYRKESPAYWAWAGWKAASKQPEQEPLTPREIELIDGMIEVQLHHAERCDSIPNRAMAEKQKGWDMERVALLRKLKAAHGIKGKNT